MAFALVIAANTLVTANAFVGITGLGALLAIAARTSIEERKLTERFGNDYQNYVARTGRFLPKFRRISGVFSR